MARSKTRFAVVGGCFLAVFIGATVFLRQSLGPSYSDEYNCAFEIKVIAEAKHTWMLEHHKTTNDIPSWSDLVGSGYFKRVPQCPNGGTYTVGGMCQLPACSNAEHNRYYRKSMGLDKGTKVAATH